jgi:hypothetical protein
MNNFFGIEKQAQLIRGNEVTITHTIKYFLPTILTTAYLDPNVVGETVVADSQAQLPPDETIFDVFYVAQKDMTLISASVFDSRYTGPTTDQDYILVVYRQGEVVWVTSTNVGGTTMASVTITSSDLNYSKEMTLVDSIIGGTDETRFVERGDRIGLFPANPSGGSSSDFQTLVVTLLFKEL